MEHAAARQCAVPRDRPARRPDSPARWGLAAIGVLCVGLGGLGVVLPGLPTTVFLIGASWCFARSCPWLEERLIRNRFFRPFLRYLDGGASMPDRARVATIAVMWAAIALSALGLWRGEAAWGWLVALPIAGAIGTVFIWRFDRARGRELAQG